MKANPRFDSDFETTTLTTVTREGDAGWSIGREDGWSFFVPASSPVTPKVGMTARFYGKGMGYPVRGLFLDGQKVFYRTAEEDDQHHAAQLYGADISEWLARWDAGKSVWSIEMGGLGPSYEQAIQITVAEFVRIMLAGNFDGSKWGDFETWQHDRKALDAAVADNARVTALCLSGCQFGAALSLASRFFRFGPASVLNRKENKPRHIQICRTFPVVS